MTGWSAPGLAKLTKDVREFSLVRRLVHMPAFQFLLVLPTTAIVTVVIISASVGIQHPSFNFGTVFTWVVWWGALLASFVVFGRAWCLVCPVGTLAEWLQRLSLWWRSPYTAGYNLRWPRRLRNLWLAIGLFLVFAWLDSGYGMSNSPRMTAGLIAVIVLAAAWTGLFFERRAFCRYLCPLTAFIGVHSLVSMFEIRRNDAGTCRVRCPEKDCYRGNEAHYGCPMGEFPGGVMDSNLYCILCTECIKSCPHNNIHLRFRVPGRDLWTARRPRFDEAFAAVTVVGVATVLPLLMVALLPDLRRVLAGILPAGAPPNDPPRLAAVALLFAGGTALSGGLAYGFSQLSRVAADVPAVHARSVFTGYAYALIPVGLAKFLADLLDHSLRTWGAVFDVTRALLVDFPWNRAVPGRVTVVHLLNPVQLYILQIGLLLGGLLFSVYAAHRISLRLFGDRKVAFASFLPMAGLAFVLTLAGVWTLGMAFL